MWMLTKEQTFLIFTQSEKKTIKMFLDYMIYVIIEPSGHQLINLTKSKRLT